MKPVKYKVDLCDWQLDAIEPLLAEVAKTALKAASEALQIILEDNDTDMYLPIMWSCGEKTQ